MIIAKKDLELALDVILRVPPRGGISCSEFIKFSDGGNSRTKLQLSSDMAAVAYLSVKYEFKHSIYLDRRLFEPFVIGGKDLKSQEYEFKVDDKNKVTVRHSSRVAVYAKTTVALGYAEPPKYSSERKFALDEKWQKLMACAISCSTVDPVVAHLNCVYLAPTKEGLSFYSSNTKVIFNGRCKTKNKPDQNIAFPLLLARNIDCISMVEMRWDDKSATLSSNRGKLWQPVKIEARKHFPQKDIDKILKERTKALFVINSQSMGNAANRLSGYLAAITREDLVLKLLVKAGEKKIKLQSGSGVTEFTEYVKLIKPSKVDYLVEWPLAEVLPVLVYAKGNDDAEVFTSDSGRTIYRTSSITLIVAAKEVKKK